MASYCTNCGSEITDSALFCSHCSFKIEEKSFPPTVRKDNKNSRWPLYILLASILIILYFLIPNKKDSSAKRTNKPVQSVSSTDKKWYEGGTLHRATIAQWRVATDDNKLATCSDFVAKIRLDKGIAFNETEILAESYALKKCIDAAQKDVDITSWKVVDIASACLVELGYK